ncbi:MAG: GNAT family N-acetyltransferase [Syntrophomonadaceae bacterium]|nr:GNAT family N-acetyltransferase [Syntrophomonadaceae bacterium]
MVESAEHLEMVGELFKEYAGSLGFSLSFQDFDRELGSLPGKYAPPEGRLLLAEIDGRGIGCVALRKIGHGVCEMKRLFVKPGLRGKGLGEALAREAISQARAIGYRRMRLDTVASMREAAGLYQKLGFLEIEPYVFNPVEGARFMELFLE